MADRHQSHHWRYAVGRGEPIDDVARVISRMADVVMIRTFDHADH